ncbi:flagellar motor switch protein FliG [Microterricola viridarii]|uniref:Flagellar motor switch protein FliG n=1 Tax=Microterricola viridarii TaxID=412690 RepID=A0A109QXS5_9MICO|nr:flagellar motor switch protein FliG [Microterricola viridarii]AMB58758.1 flagellar motor switch protein FliG [Microterricola viridarii]
MNVAKGATLSGAQKAAVVLMNMDPLRAAAVMKQFDEHEAEEIAGEIIRLRRVDAQVAEQTLAEFHTLATRGLHQTRGGRDFAVGLLEASFGAEKAAGVMSRVASTMAGRAFEFLDAAESSHVQALLSDELPQTAALVLAHLRPEHASAVLAGFEESARTDVAQCIATMGVATPEAVRILADTLKLRTGAVVSSRDSFDVVGGIQPLVEIINRSDLATERAVLEGLELRDPVLAEELRSRMLTFEDIVRLERRDVQQLLRGIDVRVLAVAMKGASEPVSEMIRSNMSERNRDVLDDEILSTGPLRLSQVEEARAEVVRAIRTLEADGQITVTRGDDDAYLD